jgi:hypothetical protein
MAARGRGSCVCSPAAVHGSVMPVCREKCELVLRADDLAESIAELRAAYSQAAGITAGYLPSGRMGRDKYTSSVETMNWVS